MPHRIRNGIYERYHRKLHSKEIYVIEKMGLENIESLNDNTELFIRLFKEGDCKKNES